MIKIKQTWLDHSGGTKFYQVFQIEPEGGKSVTITHWGKESIASGEKCIRPVLGGETQLHEGRVMTSKVNGKLKRGYYEEQTRSLNVEDDSPWFVETFGAALAHEIEVAMFCDVVADEATKKAPKSVPDTKHIEEPEAARPDGWGTW